MQEQEKNQTDQDKKTALQSKIKYLEKYQKSIRATSFNQGLNRYQRKRKYSENLKHFEKIKLSNISGLDRILNNPNEVMTRIYDSIASLYHGPITINMFPPTKQDKEFFRRFKINGKCMFDKVLRKYDLFEQMVEDGIDPKKAKAELEYTTFFRYKGKSYNFQPADFRIRGKIPNITLSQYLR